MGLRHGKRTGPCKVNAPKPIADASAQRHLHPDTTSGQNIELDSTASSEVDGPTPVRRRPVRKLPKTSSGKIAKSWRSRKPNRRLRIDIP